MAGIGFVLRKLYKDGNMSSMLRAYFHATLATSGPWIFTVMTIASLFLLNRYLVHFRAMEDFRLVILYNFCFSLVLTSPLSITATRYLSDCIYRKSLTEATGLLIGTTVCLMVVLTPLAILFYFGYAILDNTLASLAVLNFLLISSIWLVSIFISAVKYYSPITWSFFFGMLFAIVAGCQLAKYYGGLGMLLGFSLGLACILSSLIAIVFAEYPKHYEKPFAFLKYFYTHWQIGLGGFLYGLGLWVDKWIMWFSPEAVWLPSKLVMYPHYDSAMFIAYLTIIPAMAMFMLSQETVFYERYLVFYRSIQQNGNYKTIEINHQDLIKCFMLNARNLLILQGGICFIAILLAPKLFDLIGMKYIQLGMFRYGVLGSTFQGFTLFLLIVLSYFDARKEVLFLQGLFFVSNGILSFWSMKMGFGYFGLGYFLSSMITFTATAIVIERNIRNLPYLAFVKQNVALQ